MTAPLHLTNGIVNPQIFKINDVLFAFYPQRVDIIKGILARYAPAFRFKDGALEVDWVFYGNADDEARDAINLVLWASGILSSIELDNISIRRQNEGTSFYGPTGYMTRLYFHKDKTEDAFGYTEQAQKIFSEYQSVPSPSELLLLQCTQLPSYVIIERSPQFAV